MKTFIPLLNRDYLFKPYLLGVYTYIINTSLPFIYIKSNIKVVRVISTYSYLNIIIKYNINFYYTTYLKDYIYIIIKINIKVNSLLLSKEIKI